MGEMAQAAHTRIIGLTGSIGSGKSTVGALLNERGIPVVDADRLAHQVAEELEGLLCQEFPEACSAGHLDRRALGTLVFHDAERRARLEGLLHPLIRERILQDVERLQAQGYPLVVLEIPLLFEGGWDQRVEGVLVVTAPREARLARLFQRSGLSAEEVAAREAAQLPEAEKLRRAQWVIHNAGDLAALRREVEAWLQKIGFASSTTG